MQNKNGDLWIEKYKPKKMAELVTNTAAVKNIYSWLLSFDKNRKIVFSKQKGKKKKNANNTGDVVSKKDPNLKSCMLVSGGHGVGKSINVEVILKDLNYNVQKLDTVILKSGKNIEDVINKIMVNSNILNIMNGIEQKKIAIVVDEIESITSSAEKTCIMTLQKLNEQRWYCPVIFISNNQHNKLLSDIKKASFEVKFWPPFPSDMKKILMRIISAEGIKIKQENIINAIINHSQNDIRRLILTLQDIKYAYGNKIITVEMIEEYCSMSNKKDVDVDLYKATEELLYHYKNMDDCLRLYETEKVLLPLMIHQNYTKSIIANNDDKESQNDLIQKLANLLSMGDVIENYIYGDQNWEMQEIHGFFTCVAPSYYLCEDLNEFPNKVKLIFATDLNKTSIKRINKKNIINTDRCFNDMNIFDYVYINKIIRNLIAHGNIKQCVYLLKKYNIKLEHIESLLKIDKIKDSKTSLTSKQKNEFLTHLG